MRQELTDEELEEVAQAMWLAVATGRVQQPDWRNEREPTRMHYRELARVALRALPPVRVDEEMMERARKELVWSIRGFAKPCGEYQSGPNLPHPDQVYRALTAALTPPEPIPEPTHEERQHFAKTIVDMKVDLNGWTDERIITALKAVRRMDLERKR